MEDNIEPGSIFYLFCNNTHPPKPKFLVLLSDNPILWFYINSDIPAFIQYHPDLLGQQVPLIPFPNHMFLEHDSYIDCSEVIAFEDITYDDLIEMAHDTNIMRGTIDQSTIENILHVVENSDTISPHHKMSITKSLS